MTLIIAKTSAALDWLFHLYETNTGASYDNDHFYFDTLQQAHTFVQSLYAIKRHFPEAYNDEPFLIGAYYTGADHCIEICFPYHNRNWKDIKRTLKRTADWCRIL